MISAKELAEAAEKGDELTLIKYRQDKDSKIIESLWEQIIYLTKKIEEFEKEIESLKK